MKKVNILNVLNNKKIIILGHENPDVDSIFSMYLLNKVFLYLNINSQICIPDKKIDNNTKEICEFCNLSYINYFSNNLPEDEYLFLVDHYEDTRFNNEIIGCFDHHPTIKEFDYKIYKNGNFSSTTKLIYDLFKSENIFDNKDELLVYVSILVDTQCLKSSKFNKEDNKFLECFEKKNPNINYKKIQNLSLGITNLNQDINLVAYNGLKQYYFNNYSIQSSYISANNHINHNEYIEFIQNNLNCDLFIFLFINYQENSTIVYKISKNDIKTESFDKLLSRANDVMPKIEKMAERKNK